MTKQIVLSPGERQSLAPWHPRNSRRVFVQIGLTSNLLGGLVRILIPVSDAAGNTVFEPVTGLGGAMPGLSAGESMTFDVPGCDLFVDLDGAGDGAVALVNYGTSGNY